MAGSCQPLPRREVEAELLGSAGSSSSSGPPSAAAGTGAVVARLGEDVGSRARAHGDVGDAGSIDGR